MIDSAPKQPENRMHLFDPVGLINDKYAQYGVHPRGATSSHNSFASTNGVGVGASRGGMRLSVEPKAAGSDSGGSSPRLWKSSSSSRKHSPPTSLRFGGSNQTRVVQNHGQHQYPEAMSPNSRTQAIAQGQRELMEMIKDIPESCYELSLRDIVEHKPLPSPPPSPPAAVVQPLQKSKKGEVVEKKFPKQEVSETPKDKKGKEESKKKKGSKKVGKSESKKKMMRNPSVDNGGFLLKTSVFPIPFRKKKKGLNQAPSFKGAPKPPLKGPTKGSDKHWWVRKSRVSSDSDSGGLTSESVRSTSTSSSRSSSTVSRHRQNPRFLPSCCSFFKDKKMIKAKK